MLVAALLTAFAGSTTSPADLPAYYSGVNGKSGSSLFDAIHTVTLEGYKSLGYDGLWDAYYTTDVYPAGHPKEGKIWDMYSNCSFTRQCGSYNNECDCYNREHSIPKSWWGGGTSNQGCDIFHLVPTDGKVNGMRSNYAFGEVATASKVSGNGSKLGTGKSISITNTIAGNNIEAPAPTTVFEPIDEYKGDFARGYFGTLLHWTNVDMTQGEGDDVFSGSNTAGNNYGFTDYGVALLMKWHRQDPVSQKEIDRNNGIQATQGNRNPFIDYPDLAEYIWGSHTGEVFMLASATATFSDDYDPNSGTGGQGGDVPGAEPYDVQLYRNGNIETVPDLEDIFYLPTQEDDACEDWVFEGWSATKIEKTNNKPTYITWVNDDATVYAVYKNVVVGEGGSSTTKLVMEEYAAINGKFGDFTFAADKGSGTNAPTYNSNYKDARVYAKGSLTISCENEMSEIVFNLSAQGLKRLAQITASVGEITTQTKGDETVTWSGSAKSVTFTVGEKSDYGTENSAGQLCFLSVDITTGGGSKVITYASDAECEVPCVGKLATPDVTAIPGDGQITLVWADVKDADHYEVSVSAGEGFTTECGAAEIGAISKDGAINTCIISGLVNGLEYSATVRAIGTAVCDGDADTDKATPTTEAIEAFTIKFIVGVLPITVADVEYGTPMDVVLAGAEEYLMQYGITKNSEGVYEYVTPNFRYTFTGWDPELAEFVTEDATYTALYIEEPLTPTDVEMMEDGTSVQKMMENGVLYIIRNGKKYSVQGVLVK